MSSHNVIEDDSALSSADRKLFRIESWLNLAGGLLILAVMLISVVNILGRKFFNTPVPGFIDWLVQAVPLIAFLGIGYCQRLGGHIRMDLVVGRLRRRALWLFELLSIILIAGLTVILIYGSWNHAERAISIGDSTIDINLPTWPVKLAVPVMLVLLLARLALQIWGYWRALSDNATRPIAVPLIEDAAAQAAHEAETVSGMADDNESGNQAQ
ncbi:MAG: TRAP transporter small permease subunit [Rhizobiaceae bacterium]